MKPDQERVRNLLTDTVTLLCKNGLTYNDELRVEALIGITVDDDVFLVHVNESYKNDDPRPKSPEVQASDQPPPSLREKEKDRRGSASADSPSSRRHRQEMFVDLTGRDTPGPYMVSPHRQVRGQMAMSPRMATSPRGRGPYGRGQQMPSPVNQMRRGSPSGSTSSTRQQVYRSPGTAGQLQQRQMNQRMMSPHMRGQVFPRQQGPRQYSPMQNSPHVRRSLSGIMSQQIGVRGLSPQAQAQLLKQQQHALASQAAAQQRHQQQQKGPTNPEEVIVLDEPASSGDKGTMSVPTVTALGPPQARILGSVMTQPGSPRVSTPGTPPQPMTIQPVNIQPITSQPTPEANGSPTVVLPETPQLTDTESENTTSDSLSQLACVVGEQQQARIMSQEPTEITPQPDLTDSISDPGTNEAAISALQQMAETTVEELQKIADKDGSCPEQSDTENMPSGTVTITPTETPQGATDVQSPVSQSQPTLGDTTLNQSSDVHPPKIENTVKEGIDENINLTVQSVQGNFSQYDLLGQFRVMKKPPPDEPDDNGEPPSKRRAMTPASSETGSEAGHSSVGDDGSNVSASADQPSDASNVKQERAEKSLETDKGTMVVQMCKNPENNLTSWQVRELLEKHIVSPVLKKQECTITAFRMFWRSTSEDVEIAWKNIVKHRQQIDDIVAKEKGLSFFISAVTCENAPAATFPALGYWVVTRHPDYSKEHLMSAVKEHSHGAEMRLMLKADGMKMDEFGALCLMVKDYGEGLVQRKIVESASACLQSDESHPVVRFILKENFFEHMLKNAMKHLRSASFTASLEKVV